MCIRDEIRSVLGQGTEVCIMLPKNLKREVL